jgi:hypothetical protein
LVFPVIRLLEATLSGVDLNASDDGDVMNQLRSGGAVHPLAIPIKTSLCSKVSMIELLLETLFEEHECGCVVCESSRDGNPIIAPPDVEKHCHQSIASLLYQFYVSYFHLSFPTRPFSCLVFFFFLLFIITFSHQLHWFPWYESTTQ